MRGKWIEKSSRLHATKGVVHFFIRVFFPLSEELGKSPLYLSSRGKRGEKGAQLRPILSSRSISRSVMFRQLEKSKERATRQKAEKEQVFFSLFSQPLLFFLPSLFYNKITGFPFLFPPLFHSAFTGGNTFCWNWPITFPGSR